MGSAYKHACSDRGNEHDASGHRCKFHMLGNFWVRFQLSHLQTQQKVVESSQLRILGCNGCWSCIHGIVVLFCVADEWKQFELVGRSSG